jgi:hypothetical protein
MVLQALRALGLVEDEVRLPLALHEGVNTRIMEGTRGTPANRCSLSRVSAISIGRGSYIEGAEKEMRESLQGGFK